jgi:AraC-like DNA-binding protein
LDIDLNLYTILCIVGVAQGLLLSTLLLQKRKAVRANLFLAFLMLFYSLYIADKTLAAADFYLRFPYLSLLLRDATFAFGPLHYLYARALINSDFRFSKKQSLHFLPFLIAKTNYIYLYFFSDKQIIDALSGDYSPERPFVFIIDNFSVVLQGLIYMALTLVLLNRHSIKIKNVFSDTEKRTLEWLRIMTQLAIVVWLLAFFINVLKMTGNPPILTTISIIAMATSLYVYVIGYLGLRQQEILFPLSTPEPQQTAGNTTSHIINEKYAKSGLSRDKAKQHLSDLLQLMEKERPFINANLTLNELADELSISSHNLSQIINTQLKQTYFDFINHYRVEEVKKALADPAREHYTLLAIALDAGFNSKSSFNAVFKKHTNMTPFQYKQSLDRSGPPA